MSGRHMHAPDAFRNPPVACALLRVGVASKLVHQVARLQRARVADDLVPVLSQQPKLVEALAVLECADPAGVRGCAGERVGSVNLWVVACPAPRGHRQGTKLGVKLLGRGVVPVDGAVALDLGHVVDDLVQLVQDGIRQFEEVDYLGDDAGA